MKIIATSDFKNNWKWNIPGALHPLHVHKGAIFEVDEKDDRVKPILFALNSAGRVVDVDNQPEAVKQIQAEVEAEKQREARNAARGDAWMARK